MHGWHEGFALVAAHNSAYLADQTMTPDTYKKVRQPYLLGYYYKNEEEQDKVMSTAAIVNNVAILGTPESQKRLMAFPNVGHHVMTSHMRSKDVESVLKETSRYAEEVLGLVAKE